MIRPLTDLISTEYYQLSFPGTESATGQRRQMRTLALFWLIPVALLSVTNAAALQDMPAEAERHVADARAAETRADWVAAEQSYLKALNLAPEWAEAMVNLGVVYNREGRSDDAIRVFTRAAQIKPKLVAAYLNLGVTYFKAARYGQ